MLDILLALFITLALETGIYMILEHRSYKLFLTVTVLNLVLNVSMNIILSYGVHQENVYWIVLAICEVLTVLLETAFIYLEGQHNLVKVFIFALIANGVSFGVGMLINSFIKDTVTLTVLTCVFAAIYFVTFIFVTICYLKDRSTN